MPCFEWNELRRQAATTRPAASQAQVPATVAGDLPFPSLHFPDLVTPAIIAIMDLIKYIYWQDQARWLGYLQDYPDYWT